MQAADVIQAALVVCPKDGTVIGGVNSCGKIWKIQSGNARLMSGSPAWLKLKPKITLEAVVTGGSATPIPWGDRGLAVMLELRYSHPRHGSPVEIRQAVRVRRDEPFKLDIGRRAELVCWGVMPSGMLRHPLFARWRSERELA